MKAYARQAWQRAVAESAARNSPVSLRRRFDGEEDVAPTAFPSRLLAVGDDDSLTFERPTQTGASEILQIGERIDLFVQQGQQCWVGRCEVLSSAVFELNLRKCVHAIHVSRPMEVWSGQRRDFYRVDAAASGIEAFVVQLADDGDQANDEIELTSETFGGILVDLSGGGVGLRLPIQHGLSGVELGQQLRCRFRLPGCDDPFNLLAEVVRLNEVSPTHLHIGLKFVFEDRKIKDRIQNTITRFATQLEREQIKRLRGTG